MANLLSTTVSGSLSVNVDSSGSSISTVNNGNGSRWYGRITTFNSTSDKSVFLGTYASVAVVGAHNNALTAWANLYVNNVDGVSGGNVYLPTNSYVANNSIIHSGNISSQSVSVARQLLSPNNGTVVGADQAMPSAANSFIHTLALGPSNNDGHILSMTWTGTSVYGAQIFIDTDPTDTMAIRSRSSTGVWTSWKTIIHSGNIASQSVSYADESGYSASSGSVEWTSVQNKPATFPPSSHTHDDRYLPIGGGWYGSGLPGSRWGGYAVNGGEIVFGRDIPNTSQMSILVDGAYLAGENNGFWSLASDNSWGSRRGMYWDGSYLNFTTNSANSYFYDILIGGSSHKYLTINPGNGYEAMVRYIGGSGSSWYVGKRTSGQLVGTESFHFYSEAAGATVGGINPSGDMHASGSMRAPIFYDSNDTSYYLDPNSTSRLYRVNSYYLSNPADVSDNHQYGMYFSSSLSTAYAIFREGGDWAWPYQDLRIAFHTGIKLGANAGYQGIRFYTDYDMVSQVMSVNNGSDPLGQGNVYVNNSLQADSSLRAPIFYDSNDTTFYGDFNSRSVLDSLQLGTAASDTTNLKLDVQGNMAIRGANGLYFGISTNSLNSWTTKIYASGSTQYFNAQQFIFDNQGYVSQPQTFASFSSQEALFRTYPADLNYKISVTGGDTFNAYYGSGAATLYLQYHSGSGGALNVANGKLTVNTAGSVVASGDMRAPIFYDSNDTSYYLDPNSYSKLWRTSTHIAPSPGVGSSNWVTDFENTPVTSMSFGGDLSSGGPRGAWWFQQNFRHGNSSSTWGTQIAWGWEDNSKELWQRNVSAGSYSNWTRYLNTDNHQSVLPSYYMSIPAWTSGTQSAVRGSFVASGRWYRIANLGTERFFARVRIYDNSSGGPHSSVEFQVSGAYNNLAGYSFVQTSNGFYSSPSVTQVRILYAGTYDQQYLEVYINYVGDSGSAFAVSLLEARNATVVNWTDGEIPSGYSRIVWDANGPLAVAGRAAVFNDGIRSATIYDIDDSNYYINPNGISVLGGFDLNTTGTAKFRYLGPGVGTVNINAPFAFNSAAGAINIAMTDNDTGGVVIDNEGVTVYGAGDTGAVFRVIDEDVWQTNGNSVEGATTFKVLQGASAGTQTKGQIYSDSSVSAPIFYDANDTTYYLDPNSTGKSLNVAGNIDLIARSASWAEGIRVRVPSTSTWGGIRFTRDRGNDDGNWAIGYTGINSSDDLTFWANNNGDGGSMKLQMDKAGNSTFQTSVRAPIFYDSNDTNYYLNPNGYSQLSAVLANDWFRPQGGTGLYFQTYGYGIYSADSGGSPYGNVATYTEGVNSWPGYAIKNYACFMARDIRRGIFIPTQDTWLIRWESSDNMAHVDFELQWGSDIRHKSNIKRLTNSLDKVKQLKGVSYNYKGNERTSIGFIAQEVEPILPEVVSTDADGFKSVGYANIVALLSEAIKEQQAMIEELKARIEVLESK